MDFSFNTEDILLSFYRQAINFNTVFSEPLKPDTDIAAESAN